MLSANTDIQLSQSMLTNNKVMLLEKTHTKKCDHPKNKFSTHQTTQRKASQFLGVSSHSPSKIAFDKSRFIPSRHIESRRLCTISSFIVLYDLCEKGKQETERTIVGDENGLHHSFHECRSLFFVLFCLVWFGLVCPWSPVGTLPYVAT